LFSDWGSDTEKQPWHHYESLLLWAAEKKVKFTWSHYANFNTHTGGKHKWSFPVMIIKDDIFFCAW
jgi:hypothetical protein